MSRVSKQAIALVQRRVGVVADGVDGPTTRSAIALEQGQDWTWEATLAEYGVSMDAYGDPDWAKSLRRPGDSVLNLHGVSGAFVPVGVMIHHTAGPRGRAEINEHILANGRAGLRGPLVQVGISRSGKAHWITNGRAHHAGIGDKAVLETLMRDESIPHPVMDNEYGNTHFLGIEIDNCGDGKEPYPSEQVNRAADITAAWCKAFNWHQRRVIGHKEWTKRKSDPSLSMTAFRTLVGKKLSVATPTEEPADTGVVVKNPLETRLEKLEQWARTQGFSG